MCVYTYIWQQTLPRTYRDNIHFAGEKWLQVGFEPTPLASFNKDSKFECKFQSRLSLSIAID